MAHKSERYTNEAAKKGIKRVEHNEATGHGEHGAFILDTYKGDKIGRHIKTGWKTWFVLRCVLWECPARATVSADDVAAAFLPVESKS